MQNSNNPTSLQKRFTIGIDLLGGDTPPESFREAVIELVKELPGCDLALFLTQPLMSSFPDHPSIQKILVADWISMSEKPLHAIRRKKDSSLCKGMKFLSEDKIDAFVSIGNTGALVASARMRLRNIPSIDRPALLALLPTKKNPVAVIDVGGNLQCKTKHLLQFAKIGIAYQKTQGITKPSLGLLNIGSEACKGPSQLRELYEKLSQIYSPSSSQALFFGNVEGKTVFEGIVDVLVTDGFSGNIFLKTAEGVSSFVLDSFPKDVLKQCNLEKTLQYQHHGGLLCGVEKIVIKCHGDATGLTLRNAAQNAYHLLKNQFLEKLLAEVSTKKQ